MSRTASGDGRRVLIVGRGRVGGSLARAARAAGEAVRFVAGRGEGKLPAAGLVILCVPDAALLDVASRLPVVDVPSAVVHTAGVLDVDHLAIVRARGWSVGQAHPLVAVATTRTDLSRATLLVGGDPLAVRRARRLARALAMRPLVAPGLDRALWHAIAALVANGASALASIGSASWQRAGIPEPASRVAIGALLASVARNVTEVGTPAALTGPVRRGDVAAVDRHLATLTRVDPSGSLPRLYAALALAQIELASALGEASAPALHRIARSASRVANPTRRARRVAPARGPR